MAKFNIEKARYLCTTLGFRLMMRQDIAQYIKQEVNISPKDPSLTSTDFDTVR
jgi:hypothetical protein